MDDAEAGGETESIVRDIGEDALIGSSSRGLCRGGSSFEGRESLSFRFRGSTDFALLFAPAAGGVAASAECARAFGSASFMKRALCETTAFALALLMPFSFPVWPLLLVDSWLCLSLFKLESRLETLLRVGSDFVVNEGLEMSASSFRPGFMTRFFDFALSLPSSDK